MGVEVGALALRPVRILGIGVLRRPVVADRLDLIVRRVQIRVLIIDRIVVDEGLAKDIGEVRREREELPSATQAETTVDRRVQSQSGVLDEGGLVESLGRLVHRQHIGIVTRDIPHLAAIGRVDTRIDRSVEHDRLALHISEAIGIQLPAVAAQFFIPGSVEELGNLFAIVVEIGIETQIVVATLEDVDTERNVNTRIGQTTDVGGKLRETGRVRIRDIHEHVGSLTAIELQFEIDEVKEPAAETGAEQRLLLPGQVVVGRLADDKGVPVVIVGRSGEQREVAVVADLGVTLRTVADLEGRILQPVHALHERLAAHIPTATDSPERSIALVDTETGGSVVTDRSVNDVFVSIAVVGMAEEGEEFAGLRLL